MSMANIGSFAGGGAKGLGMGQDFANNQQMQPLQQQYQQLRNAQLQQHLAGGQAGSDWDTALGQAGIAGITDVGPQGQGQAHQAYPGAGGAGGQGGQGGQGGPGQGRLQGGGSWNQLVDPLGLLQRSGLPMPPDPSTLLQTLGFAPVQGTSQYNQGPTNPQQQYGGQQSPAGNYFGIGSGFGW